MIRLVRDFRLIPIMLVAAICLFVLKALGLVFDGGYTLGDLGRGAGDMADVTGSVPQKRAEADALPEPPPAPKSSWAREMFNYPDVTGSVPAPAAAPTAPAAKGNAPGAKPQEPPPTQGWIQVPLDGERPLSQAERAILARLQERRAELDALGRELEMRENLLKAAEKRLEGRVAELKDLEARVNSAIQQKDDGDAAKFKNLVSMYENMKAKDAAKIFDRLDIKILVDVATQINPRRMSDILAQMSTDAAERLTVELANRAAPRDKPQAVELPKIEGRPTAN